MEGGLSPDQGDGLKIPLLDSEVYLLTDLLKALNISIVDIITTPAMYVAAEISFNREMWRILY